MDIVSTLGTKERVVLSELKGRQSLSSLISATGLTEVEVMRALQWLSNKGLVRLDKSASEVVGLGKNGRQYKKSGLPERVFLKSLEGGKKKPEDIPLSKQEVMVSIGVLKQQAAITVEKPLAFELTAHGKKLLEKESLEEQFLKSLPRKLDELKPEEKLALERLKKRKDIIEQHEEKSVYAELTSKGKKLGKLKAEKLIGRLTPLQLASGSWKQGNFKAFDIASKVPEKQGGQRHILYQAIDYIRRIWLDMGFKEMTGPLIQPSFWNFDALFTAQDHPVRDIQDTFFLEDPKQAKLPAQQLVNRVKKTHENGWTTGSRGWEYAWDEDTAKLNCMRTHTTCLSARTIASLKTSQLPAKFFSVGRNFRNETIDWGHSFEFYQVEGIVVSKHVTFKHLLGYLREYYRKLGYDKVRFRPGYFPYTEMSVEPEVYLKERGVWIELGGAGMFRPEVVKPLLGVDVPVLAWGQGLERGILEYLGLNDLRKLYSTSLGKQRRSWIK